jgi:flagellar biosynthesis GTPase FlhF
LRPSESSTREGGGPVRTYHGRTIEELLPKIQEELGADAIIVRRREGLAGGVAGFFQRPFVELDAIAGGPRLDVYDEEPAAWTPDSAADYPLPAEHMQASYLQRGHLPPGHQSPEHYPTPEPAPPSGHAPAPQHTPQPKPARPEHQSSYDEPRATRTPFYAREPLRLGRDGRYVTEGLAALARAGALRPRSQPVFEPPATTAPHELRSTDPRDPFALMLEQAASTDPIDATPTDSISPVGTVPRSSPLSLRAPAPRLRAQAKIQRGLLALGASERFAVELLDAAAVHVRPLAPRASLSQTVRLALAQRIPIAPPLPIQGGVIVLVGPGGAGKTSCCAALLGAYRKSSALPASCATLLGGPRDGELRMLLSPQIRKPLSVETSRAVRALRKARGEGLLVIDTPALSPSDRSAIRKLASLLGELKPEQVAIVLPITLGAVATAQLLQALRPLGANALALTHAEETDQMGVAVEAACKFGLAPEYMLKRARPGGWSIGRVDPTGLAAKLVQ